MPETREQATGARTSQTSQVTTRPEAGEVFLSPRVVDQRAFDDLAGRLRALLDEASKVEQALADAAGAGKHAEARLGAIVQRQAERVGALRGVLGALEERREAADQAARRLEERTERAERAEASLELRLAQVEEQIAGAMRAAEETWSARAAGAEVMTKRLGALEMRVSIVESVSERVHELASRVERLMEDRASRRATDDADPPDAQRREAETALEGWSRIRSEAGAARSAVTDATREAGDAAGRLDEAGARAEELLGRAEEASEELSRLLHKGDTLAQLLDRLTGPQRVAQ